MKLLSVPRARRASLLVFAAAAACSLVSCWVPVYDPALSASARFEKKLELVSRIGPSELFDDESEVVRYFVPRRVATPAEGYLVSEGMGYIRLAYIGRTAEGNFAQLAQWGNSTEIPGWSLVFARPVPTGLPEDRTVIVLAGRGTSNTWQLSYAAGSIASSTAASWTPADTGQTLVGVGQAAHASGASAAYLHTWTSPPLKSNMQVYDTSTGSTSPTGTNTNLYAGPNLHGPGFYSLSYNNNFHFFSARDAEGRVRAYRWTQPPSAALPVELSGVDRMLTGLLSDDTLVAQGSISSTFYDSSGNTRFELPTGALRFIHEVQDGGIWYSYFSRTMVIARRDGPDELWIDIFRYPTAKLPDLAQ